MIYKLNNFTLDQLSTNTDYFSVTLKDDAGKTLYVRTFATREMAQADIRRHIEDQRTSYRWSTYKGATVFGE